jgi:hypothetical protein
MKRVAGMRRMPRRRALTSELPFMRVYAPQTVELGEEVMAMWQKSIGEATGRTWCMARENDLFIRFYLLPRARG